jgi:predicted Fe-Mo cluster-binding NifX family protein
MASDKLSSATRTAVTVMDPAEGACLCPFFGKCHGIVVLDSRAGTRAFHSNPARTPETLCDLIIAIDADRLVCGYIGDSERDRLRAAGVDVRLGSCTCAPEELAASFFDLTAA